VTPSSAAAGIFQRATGITTRAKPTEEEPMPGAKPIPDTYPRVSPHLSVAGAAAAIDFYRDVFDARERLRMGPPDGTVAHAEIEIGDSVIMVGEEIPGGRDPSPKTLGGSPVALFTYVEDVDEVFNRAINAGASTVQEPEDQFYGDRVAMFDDPFGHRWNVATHIEDVPPDEMERRAAAAMGGS
jgi:PhnB protein